METLQGKDVLDEGAAINREDGGNEDALGQEENVEGGSKVGVGGGAVDPCGRGGRGRRGGSGREGRAVEAEKAVEEQDGGVDELLAMLRYKVHCSDMVDVAQKLEQLEMAMGNSTT